MTDQDTTDFEKSIMYIVEKESKNELGKFRVFAMGAFGGRMDQTLAAIHVLTKYAHILDK